MDWKIETKRQSDPVFVTDYGSEDGVVDTIEVRIGHRRSGETRYADLTPWQARKLAVALLWASAGEDPDKDPNTPGVFMTFHRKSKSK